MKKLFAIATLIAGTLMMVSCSDDDGGTSVDAPEVTAPGAADVTTGQSIELSFNYNAVGGFAASAVAATGGTASVTTDGEAGATSGTITVTFEAGDEGAGSVVLTVTDAEGNADDATVVLTIVAEDVTPVITVRGNIETNTTWTADNIYQLDTRVTVVDGVTLTIEPGTVIKGNEGQGAAATALLVARGGMLMAEGTAELPIIFTSVNDPIDPSDIAAGNYASTTSPTTAGEWGGVIILGNAQISVQNDNDEDVTEVQIEGIPASDPNGLYGGTDNADNSGVITYISIRHGGTNIGAGNEINGLTLGGVGSGTTISNVEVVANADDGIEWFGGNVSVDNVVIWNSNDDSMDTDQDWVGTCSNFIIVTPVTGSAFELDGPEGSLNRGTHQFTNGVVYAGAEIDHIIDWDGSTNAGVSDVYFFGLTDGAGNIESYGGDGTGVNTGWETDLADAGTYFLDDDDADSATPSIALPSGVVTYGVAVGSKTKGPSAADFAWTWAGNSGALADLGL
ncbi:hypothetical protein [Ekhidna sp.]|uniref:hypothetical protein n=1 Tax=Ekhidna sp. TaxID=2608089 RepID=UPI003CCBF00D